MHLARSSAMYAAPVPLRLILAFTFIWAGLGKFVATIPVQGEQAALLANMGYDLPEPEVPPAAATGSIAPEFGDGRAASDSPVPPSSAGSAGSGAEGQSARADSPSLAVQHPAIAHTAEEFPNPVEVSRLYGLALLTYKAAHPSPGAEGVGPPPIWPEWAARDRWPIYIAWGVSIAELVAGVLVLVGLLTRFSALLIAGIMVTAMWLTEIGPAIQIGETFLGFLPRRDPWDVSAWKSMLWQMALIGSALALVFAGPGAFSLDRVGPHHDDEFDDDDEEDDDA